MRRFKQLLIAILLSLAFLIQACAEKPSSNEQKASSASIEPTSSVPPPPAWVAHPRKFDRATSDAQDWTKFAENEPRGASSPREAADGLYRTIVERNAAGIPSGKDIPAYRRWLSQRLLRGFFEGAIERDKFIAQDTDMKPPYVDGDMFTSLFEGPTGFKVLRQIPESPDRVRFDIQLEYKDRTGSSNWVDHAIAIRENERWVIDDIEYGGDWDFATHGRLSEQLPAKEAK